MGDAGKRDSGVSAPSIQVRAPVSDEMEGPDEKWRNANGGHTAPKQSQQHQESKETGQNGEAGDWRDDGDGNFSDYSDESFDSAFERMAASTSWSFNTANSPNTPLDTFGGGNMFDYSSPMDMSQQGALMRLNKMLTGDDSLDDSVIENCTDEEFIQRVDHLARSRGQTLEDASFGSILEALLPLVQKRSKDGATKGESLADRLNAAADAHPSSDDEEIVPADDADKANEHLSEAPETPDSDESFPVVGKDFKGNDDEQRDGTEAEELARVSCQDTMDGTRPKANLSAEDLDFDYGSPESMEEHQVSKSREETQPRPFAKLSEEDVNFGWQGVRGSDDRDGEKKEQHGETENGEEMHFEGNFANKFTVSDNPRVVDGKLGHGEDEPLSLQNSQESTDVKALVNGGNNAYSEGDDESTDVESEESGKPSKTSSSDLPGLEYISTNSSPDRLGLEYRLRMNSAQAEGSSPPLEPTTPLQQQQDQPRRVTSDQVTSTFPDRSRHANGEHGTQRHNEGPRDKLEIIRVQFLRVALRLGQSTRNAVVEQVLYQLGLAEQLRGGRGGNRASAFTFDVAREIAEEQEATCARGREDPEFTCTIMLLGKTGVGKSAMINAIFDDNKTETDAFRPSTKKIQVITGHVHGIRVRVIDTPGLLSAATDQRQNERTMSSVKKFIRNQTPDIVLYVDRLDMQSRDFSDLPLLRTITNTFGAAIWFNTIVVLTHACSAPPEGPSGPLSYEMFVSQRSQVVQQTIRHAAEDVRLMNPVSLVENHSSCRATQSKERVLPNGIVWKPQLLLLCFASKILAEANALLKLQDNTPGKPFGTGTRAPPLPFLLSSLLQARAQVKLPGGQVGKNEFESDDDASVQSSEDEDDADQLDRLPPFRRLSNTEVMDLDEDNRCKYNEDLAEREMLFQKKLRKQERMRRRELRTKMAGADVDRSQIALNNAVEPKRSEVATLPVPLPDMDLPLSFDSDNPVYRYRYLESANQWLVRPIVESHGWDHDSGFDAMSLEKMFVVGSWVPVILSGQFTKDKGDMSLNMECTTSLNHGVGKYTQAGLDVRTVGKDIAYTVRSETQFSNGKSNKATGGLAFTLLGDTISGGLKVEDRLSIGKRAKLILSGGLITGCNDVAYGGSVEATFRDQDNPLSSAVSSLGISVMDWHGEVAVGGNAQTQFLFDKAMLVGTGNLNNKGAGKISIKVNSSEQFWMALIGVLPIVRVIVNRFLWAQAQS